MVASGVSAEVAKKVQVAAGGRRGGAGPYPAVLGGARLTTLRTVSVNGRRTDSRRKKMVMKIAVETFERLRENSSRYGSTESYDEILIRLIDFYEYEKEKPFIQNKDKILY